MQISNRSVYISPFVCLSGFFCPYKAGFVTFSKTIEPITLKFTHMMRVSPRVVWVYLILFFKCVCLSICLSVKTQKSCFCQLSPKRPNRLSSNSHTSSVLVRSCFGYLFFSSNVSVCLSVCS